MSLNPVSTIAGSDQTVWMRKVKLGLQCLSYQFMFNKFTVIVGGDRTHGQMEFAPNAPFLLAMLANFLLAFAVDLEAGGIND